MRVREHNLVCQRLVLTSQMMLRHAINSLFLCAGSYLRHVIVKWDRFIKVHLNRAFRVAYHATLALFSVTGVNALAPGSAAHVRVSWVVRAALGIRIVGVTLDFFPGNYPAVFILLNVKLLQSFFGYQLKQNWVIFMGNWHNFIEYDVAKPFFVRIIGSLVVKHHIMEVLLVSQGVHHEELWCNLF